MSTTSSSSPPSDEGKLKIEANRVAALALKRKREEEKKSQEQEERAQELVCENCGKGPIDEVVFRDFNESICVVCRNNDDDFEFVPKGYNTFPLF